MQPGTEIEGGVAAAGDVAAGLRSLGGTLVETPPNAQKPPRFWTPSLSDFLFVSLIVWLFLAGPNGWAALLSDGDTGWHIRVGDWMRQHQAFPRTDFLSFSKPGEPWFAWEWAAEWLMSWLHETAALKGVVLGLGLLIPAYLLIVFRHAMWRGATPFIALPVLLLASGASAIHFLARPHLFTLAFLAVSLWLIEADRRRPSMRIGWLIPLSLVWANLHGGFLAVVASLSLVAAGSVLAKQGRQGLRYAILAAACFAISIANPYGYHLHEHIFTYLRSDWIKDAVDEFQSPKFRSEAMLMYEVLLFGALVTVYRAVRRGNWADALLVMGWAHLSLTSVRHVPIFLLVAAPVLASELTAWWKEIHTGLPRRSLLRTLDTISSDLGPGFARNSVWIAVPILALVLLDRPIPWPKTFPEERFPVTLIEQQQAHLAGKRVLTTDEWGDYLSYRFYPVQRVFFDGRSDFFGEKLGRVYLSLMQGASAAHRELDRFAFETVLVPPDWPIQEALRRNPEWELVADGKKAVLFRRRVPGVAKKF